MSNAALIPDRRRKYFPRNGGARPTSSDRIHGRSGLAKARAALDAVAPSPPSDPTVISRHTPEQSLRARRGIAAARAALNEPARDD